jgi:hypothetical protein
MNFGDMMGSNKETRMYWGRGYKPRIGDGGYKGQPFYGDPIEILTGDILGDIDMRVPLWDILLTMKFG